MTLASIQPDFVYGPCSQVARQNNWALFKKLCDEQKLHGGTIDLGNSTIELYHADKEKIMLEDRHALNITGTTYDLVFYPFVPRDGYNYVFDFDPGAKLSIHGGTIKVAQRQNYFESYHCNFKAPRTISVTGTVRLDFWETLKIGQVVFYTWSKAVLGKVSAVSAFDRATKTVTIADDLAGNNALPYESWIGFDFVEGVSESDYTKFGHHWVRDPKIFTLINHFPVWQVTGPDAVISLSSVKIKNWKYPINISSGAFKLNLNGTVEIDSSEIAIQAFARSQMNHQSILGPKATLILRDNGMNSVGSLDIISSGNIWGSGAYIHPTVIVQIDKVRGYDNAAFTFRQYSSSIEATCPPDYQSWIHDFQCVGSMEGDLRTSNSMPFVLDYFKGGSVLSPGGNLILKRGDIASIKFTSLFHPTDGAKSFVQINKATITGTISISWPHDAAALLDVEINDSLIVADGIANSPKIYAGQAPVKSITLNNIKYQRPAGSLIKTYVVGVPVPDGETATEGAAASLIMTAGFLAVKISKVVTDFMKGAFVEQNINQTLPPFDKVIIHIDHSELNMSKFFDDNVNSHRFIEGQIEGVETSVPCQGLTGTWKKPNY